MRLGGHSASGTKHLTYYKHMPGNSTLKPFEKLAQRKAMDPSKVQTLFQATLEPVKLVRLSDFLHSYDLVGHPESARVAGAEAAAPARDHARATGGGRERRFIDLLKVRPAELRGVPVLSHATVRRLTLKGANLKCYRVLTPRTGRASDRCMAAIVSPCKRRAINIFPLSCTLCCVCAQVTMEAHAVGDRLDRICALLRSLEFHVTAIQPALCERAGLNNWQVYATRNSGHSAAASAASGAPLG